MTYQIASKLELNVLDSLSKPEYINNFAIKNRLPAVVATSDYIAPLAANRAARQGKYKLICAIDFPKGGEFALDKIYRTNPDLVGADGFDILLSVDRSEIETRNEMKALTEFLRMNRPMCEIRWCLKLHTHPNEAMKALTGMSKHSPTFVRVDPHLALPKVNLDTQLGHVKLITENVPYNIKISGNVDLVMITELLKNRAVKRFDVSLEQAEQLIKNLPKAAAVPPPLRPKGPAVKKGNFSRIRIK